MCCTNSRSGAGEREGSHSPGHSRARLSPASAFVCQHTAAAAATSHPHPELPRAGPDTTSTATPEAQRAWDTHSSLGHPFHYRVRPGPESLWHFLYPGQGQWLAQRDPLTPAVCCGVPFSCTLSAVITRNGKGKHLPGRHPALGSALVLVRKNGYNTLQTWLTLSAGIKERSLQDRHSLSSYFCAVFEIQLII